MFYPPTWTGAQFVVPGVLPDGVAFWTSPDGSNWARQPDRSWGYVASFAFDGKGGGVAVGWLKDHAAAWRSADGLRWKAVPVTPAMAPGSDESAVRMTSVARGAAGYVALGEASAPSQPDTRAVFASADGTSWSRLEVDVFSRASLVGIAAIAGRYVVAGTVETGTPAPRAAVWTSDDGMTWTPAAIEGSGVTGIAAGPHGLIVTGNPAAGGAASPSPGRLGLVWWTADGRSWTVAETIVPDPVSLRAAPDGWYCTMFLSGLPRLAWSADGRTWGLLDPTATRDIAASGSYVVALPWAGAARDGLLAGTIRG